MLQSVRLYLPLWRIKEAASRPEERRDVVKAVFSGGKSGVAKGLHAGSPEAGLNGKRTSDTVTGGM